MDARFHVGQAIVDVRLNIPQIERVIEIRVARYFVLVGFFKIKINLKKRD